MTTSDDISRDDRHHTETYSRDEPRPEPTMTNPLVPYVSTPPVVARRRWPLLLIGASAGTATWTGWVGLGQLTGFGVVHPLPGIWDALTVNTAITLPVGVEAYAVYALAVATDPPNRTAIARRYAWVSAAGALLLGVSGQIAFHLLEARGVTAAPWWVVALVSSLPVLVLGAASLLWHLAAIDPPVVAAPAAEPVAVRSLAPAVPSPDSASTAILGTDTPPGAASGASTRGPGAAILADASAPDRNVPPPARPLGRPAASDTAATAPSATSTAGRATRALARPAAATSARPAVREPIPASDDEAAVEPVATASGAASDAQILATIAGEPPSIRSLMRTHGIGQARATRIHRAAATNHDHRQSSAAAQHDRPVSDQPTPPTGTQDSPDPDHRSSRQDNRQDHHPGDDQDHQRQEEPPQEAKKKDQDRNTKNPEDQEKITTRQLREESEGIRSQNTHTCITDRVGQTTIAAGMAGLDAGGIPDAVATAGAAPSPQLRAPAAAPSDPHAGADTYVTSGADPLPTNGYRPADDHHADLDERVGPSLPLWEA
jgi:hypothetical protein